MQTADSYNLPLQYAYGPIFKNTIDRAYPYAYALRSLRIPSVHTLLQRWQMPDRFPSRSRQGGAFSLAAATSASKWRRLSSSRCRR